METSQIMLSFANISGKKIEADLMAARPPAMGAPCC